MHNSVSSNPTAMQRRDDFERGTEESIDNISWASAQGLALSKMQVYGAMAKKINDQ